jgi:hypothetical protein
VSGLECRGEMHNTSSRAPFFTRHPSLLPRPSFLPHRFNRTRKNSDDFVEQLDPSFDLILSQPVFHPFVAPTRLTSRASCDVEETNVLDPAQPPITLFDVCADRICAAYLLRDEPR